MVAHVRTVECLGVDSVPVDVQVHLAPGRNAFTVVGLPDKSVAESRERVRAAQMGRQNCLNAHLDGEALYKLAAPDSAGQNLLDRIADTKKLSARGLTVFFGWLARWPISTIATRRARKILPPQFAGAISHFNMLVCFFTIVLYTRNKIEKQTAA